MEVIVYKKNVNGEWIWETDVIDCLCSKSVGKGKTWKEALGEFFYLNQTIMGYMVSIDESEARVAEDWPEPNKRYQPDQPSKPNDIYKEDKGPSPAEWAKWCAKPDDSEAGGDDTGDGDI